MMATTREELREQLVAAIEAAPELNPEDRQHLADVFLDQLDARYDLVPRGTGTRPQPTRTVGGPPWRPHWVPFALLFAFLIFVVPATLHHHGPLLLFAALAVFIAVRRGAFGMWRGRMARW